MKKIYKKKNLTHRYLQGAAYRYLERYATTEANLYFILKRKATRIIADDENRSEMSEKAALWIKDIVENCLKNNLVDDRLYAKNRTNSLINSANSLSTISNKLTAKGVPQAIIGEVIEQVLSNKPDLNLKSCIKYAKKRRFGPYRIKEIQENTDKKEIASMARAGYSYSEAVKVLNATRSELEDILYES